MTVYNRDNIAHQSMIDNMIKNRLDTMTRYNDRTIKKADIRSGEAKNLASLFARTMDYAEYENEQKELKKKLEELEERRDYIRSQYNDYNDYRPDVLRATEQMKGYRPTILPDDVKLENTNVGDKYKTGQTWIMDSAKAKWLQAHPGMTEEDYDKFAEYQRAMWG